MNNQIVVILLTISARGCFLNKTQNLLSTYAKVAYWGSTPNTKTPNEARSNTGQSLWTHRSDVNIRGGQNIKEQNSPVYYYSVPLLNSKVDAIKQEVLPAKGEILERFNPRPYFDFTFDDPRPNKKQETMKTKTENGDNNKEKSPNVVYGMSVNTVPSFNNPPIQTLELESKPLGDAYSSPYSSYNPPNENKKEPATQDYLPNQQNPQKDDSKPIDSYTISDSNPTTTDMQDNSNANFYPPLVKPSSTYYGPPPPPHGSDDGSYNFPNTPISTNHKKPPSNIYGGTDQQIPNKTSPKSPSSAYGPPEQDDENGPQITPTIMPSKDVQSEYLDNPPNDHDHHHPKEPSMSMAEEDLSPPPSNGMYGNIPQYLDHEPKHHDFYHYSPHVYHEVTTTTTTTTPAPRATGHYSYYYLGRKLWYIPLYFSVYFIIYVTFLIIKSIARHKIQFSQNFDKARDSRDLNSINQHVMMSIENAKNKYM